MLSRREVPLYADRRERREGQDLTWTSKGRSTPIAVDPTVYRHDEAGCNLSVGPFTVFPEGVEVEMKLEGPERAWSVADPRDFFTPATGDESRAIVFEVLADNSVVASNVAPSGACWGPGPDRRLAIVHGGADGSIWWLSPVPSPNGLALRIRWNAEGLEEWTFSPTSLAELLGGR